MKKTPAKKTPAKITPASLTKPPRSGIRHYKKGPAIVGTSLGTLYENTKYPERRPWAKPIDSAVLADRVQALIRAEHEERPERTPRQQEQYEREKQRPKRHQVTIYLPLDLQQHPANEFGLYPGKRMPFTPKAKGRRKKAAPKPNFKVVVRRRYALRAAPPESDDDRAGVHDVNQ
jgi:hypothetical protein